MLLCANQLRMQFVMPNRLGPRIAAVLMMASASAASQDNYACQAAIDDYNAAISELSSSLRRYARCVSNSQGQDDCFSEFRRLRSAHDDFESAVSDYRLECE